MFPRQLHLGFQLPFFTFSANLITRQKGTMAAILHLQSVKMPRSRNHAEYTTKTCCLSWLLVIMPTMYQQTRSSSSQLEVALVVVVVVVVVVAVVAVAAVATVATVAAVAAVVDAVGAVDVEVVADAVADVVIDLGRNSKFLRSCIRLAGTQKLLWNQALKFGGSPRKACRIRKFERSEIR